MTTRLVFGCGYLGLRVARLWREAGDDVVAVTRCPARVDPFRREGFTPLVADVTRPLPPLPEADTCLFAVGYDRGSDASIGEVYADGLRGVLSALPLSVRRVIYISSTGVYGDAAGAWVDETTPPDPRREGGRASLAAEEALRSSFFADRGVALRLAGIYGPGRAPFLENLRAGAPIPAVREGWLNLIHVDDAATAVLAAAAAQPVSSVYCVSDGRPPQRGDYYAEAARLIGGKPPVFVEPAEGTPRAARAAADKRVSNRRMTQELGCELRYADFRAGLAAILGSTAGSG
ncbi:NAD dependent epimerase/dehydratase family protein [Pirellulimonas nuda]|uniref:NAD dependent epimerase/dehydratase family protein n=1 Tax=Pirellulimonas nuda TaxID=2528009 RepID=A0A518D8R8_9BACT|nr:SDR family oxidoreductase [Pirellulimonas nuda]QDU87872.1 NAD dependent epimerase/dehydratase family protein [Pirellulimonas nuda]